jgi:hypothetical protein
MSQGLKQTWQFRQKSYIKQHSLGGIGSSSEGVCISLSCRWAKMMLKSDKALFSVPRLDEQQRTTYFTKQAVPTKIAINQDLFDKERETAHAEVQLAKQSKKTADDRYNKGEISFAEYEILSDGIIGNITPLVETASKNSLRKILQSNKLTIVENQSCQSFSEYFLGAKGGCCYIFSSEGLKHAMAGYATGGVFSNDYYFFDPNSGEFIASGNSEIAVVMHAFKQHYRKLGYTNSKTSRLRVEYHK